MKVGFTGTRNGMNDQQAYMLGALLEELKVTELHHGDCNGADAQAHFLATSRNIRVVLHPPANDRERAHLEAECAAVRAPLPYLVRNRNIVIETEVLIATPSTVRETLRSGTWATVRYAGELRRTRYVLLPDRRTVMVIK